MRSVFAALGFKPDALHQPLVLGLQIHQRLRRRDIGATTARGLRPPKDDNAVEPQFERLRD